MTHKQECIGYCLDHLNSRSLAHTYNDKEFESYYRKHNGAQSNAFSIAINAADLMIKSFKPQTQEVYYDDRSNAS